MAWVEWQFADFARLKSKGGLSFVCVKCPAEVRRKRNCDASGWENAPGQVYPIILIGAIFTIY